MRFVLQRPTKSKRKGKFRGKGMEKKAQITVCGNINEAILATLVSTNVQSNAYHPEHHNYYTNENIENYNSRELDSKISKNFLKTTNKKKKNKKMSSQSLPVNIPEPNFNSGDSDENEDDLYEEGELIPPHIIIGRRVAGKMAFSVCTGNGRTLKGRDLSQVRNSILRLTGFLES
ncbi:Senescence regulator S40 [Dillenia turbinata]|uniref:Senescence regulator S40 n=1 Tax=Dillenia turbinata TaxID=194707 RepID=A0AAN8VIG7_9MAGN